MFLLDKYLWLEVIFLSEDILFAQFFLFSISHVLIQSLNAVLT